TMKIWQQDAIAKFALKTAKSWKTRWVKHEDARHFQNSLSEYAADQTSHVPDRDRRRSRRVYADTDIRYWCRHQQIYRRTSRCDGRYQPGVRHACTNHGRFHELCRE